MNRYLFTLILSVLFVPLSLFAEHKDNEKTLTNISAAEDSVIAKFSIGDSITFNTSFDSICGGFRERIIESGTKNIMYEAFNSVKNEKGEWVLKFYEDVMLQKDRTYTLEIEGHEVADSKSKVVGKVSVIYRGDGVKGQDEVDDYEYSNIKYLRLIEEDEELKSLRLNFITVQFTGDVIIDAERSQIIDEDDKDYPFPSIITINNSESDWQLNVPLELMLQSTTRLTFRIFAKDKAGRAIKGNRGKGENSYYEFFCKCEMGYPFLSILPEEGSYTSLKEFTFSNNQGIEILNPESEIVLKSSDDEVVVSFPASDLEQGADSLSFTYNLDQVFVLVGNYTLVVPEGTFAIGAKMKVNKETSADYFIGNKLESYGVESIDPEDGSDVDCLSKFIITFYDMAIPEYYNLQKINVTNELDSIITYAKATFDENRENDGQCIIVLESPVTEPGIYHLNIPENAFSLGLWGESISKEMTFDYTVLGIPDPVYDYQTNCIADADHKIERIEISFTSMGYVDLTNSRTNLYRDVIIKDSMNNEAIAIGKLRIGQYQNQLYVDSLLYISSLQEEYGEKLGTGKYWLHIAAGILIFGSEIYEKDLDLKINFDPAYDVNVRTEEDKDQKLESVDLVFLNYGVVDLKDSRTVLYHDVTMTDSEDNVIANAQISIGRQQNNLLVVDNIRTVDSMKDELGEKLGAGNYWLHVPAGIMILDGEIYDKEYVLEIEFSPIVTNAPSAIARKSSDRVRVYNAQGMLSRDVKDPETALRGLRRGMYIINGKKVLIK